MGQGRRDCASLPLPTFFKVSLFFKKSLSYVHKTPTSIFITATICMSMMKGRSSGLRVSDVVMNRCWFPRLLVPFSITYNVQSVQPIFLEVRTGYTRLDRLTVDTLSARINRGRSRLWLLLAWIYLSRGVPILLVLSLCKYAHANCSHLKLHKTIMQGRANKSHGVYPSHPIPHKSPNPSIPLRRSPPRPRCYPRGSSPPSSNPR